MKHWVIVGLHRLITDLSILGFSFPKLAALYAPYRVGRWLDTDTLSKQIAYWRRQLAGDIPTLQLFTDRDGPAAPSSRIVSTPVTLPADLVRALHAVVASEQVTPSMTLLAAFAALLHRYSGQHDIVVGAMMDAGPDARPRAGARNTRLLPFRIDLSGNPTFRTVLERVRRVTLDAEANRDVPLAQLKELLR